MKRITAVITCATAIGTLANALAQTPLGTNFTYQGRLLSGGSPANGSYDFIFRLWDAPTGGNNLGASNATLVVTNGLFTANLDFGDQFDGDQRWIDMLVRPTGAPSYTPLSPRQPISATPYAHVAVSALSVDGLDGHSLDAADGSPPDALLVDNDGYVGVGTSAPLAPLDVVGSNPFPHVRVGAAADAPYGAFLSIDAAATAGGNEYLIFSTGNAAGEGPGKLIFQNQSDGVPAMAITDNGNVGVGTLNPTAKLSVAGTIESTSGGFKFPNGTIQLTAATSSGGGTNWIANGPDIVYTNSSVGIRTSQPTGPFEVSDGTGSPGGVQMDQANEVFGDFGCTASTASGPWQSFTAGVTGVLTRVDVFLGTLSGGQVIVEVLIGQGTAGGLLGDAIFTPEYPGFEGWAVIDLTALNPNQMNVTAGSVYTIRLSGGSYAWDGSCSNAYPGGISSLGAGYDFEFRTFVDVPANTGSLFRVQPTGGVRIRVPTGSTQPAIRVVTPTGEELQVSKDCRINSFNHSLSFNGSSDENIFLANGGGNVLMGTYANEQVNNPHGLSKYLYIAGDGTGSYPGSAGVIFNRPAGGTWSVGVNAQGSFSFFATSAVSSPVVYVPALGVTGGSDIAEPFNVNTVGAVSDRDGPGAVQSRDPGHNSRVPDDREGVETIVEPGMVVSIDPDRVGELRLSSEAYDPAVAGIISGAGGVRPGLTLTQEESVADGKHPVALTGRVWCWCDADAGGAIKAGDSLTTSATPGHAMKVSDRQRAGGATLGKAMSSLRNGKGLVLVLVNLQ